MESKAIPRVELACVSSTGGPAAKPTEKMFAPAGVMTRVARHAVIPIQKTLSRTRLRARFLKVAEIAEDERRLERQNHIERTPRTTVVGLFLLSGLRLGAMRKSEHEQYQH